MRESGLLLNGEWVKTGKWIPVTNPWDGEKIGRVSLGGMDAMESALSSAVATFETVRKEPAFERASRLRRIAGLVHERRAEFADCIMREAGKPITLAEIEVDRAVATFTAAAEVAGQSFGEVLSLDAFAPGAGHSGFARRFPLGVIVGITPFNAPLNLAAHKVGPALAAGNCIILKPSPRTPLTSCLLGDVLRTAGVPAGQVNVLTCRNEDVLGLIGDDRVKMVSFTGSGAVGWELKAQCAKKRVLLELGGSAPVIVHEDADVPAAIPQIASSAFGYAGQTCISTQRILIHHSIYGAFRERFLTYVRQKVRTGDPAQRDVIVGPMIDQAARERVVQWIGEAVALGAKLLIGGDVDGPCVQPTVLENVPPRANLATKEAFAPVVLLQSYTDFHEAIRIANATPFGLQAGVFTRDIRLAFAAYEQIDAGSVLINEVPTFRVDNMPYGGIKESGFGREGLRYAVEEMTELKSFIVNLQKPPP